MNKWETVEIDICGGCLVATAGEITTEDDRRAAAGLAELWPGWAVHHTGEDMDGSFSWQACDGCGERLGGQRYPAVAMIQLEYRVWTEGADLVYAGHDREAADAAMGEAIQDHIVDAECRGCGVLTPPEHHGLSVQICRGDQDVTGDPTYN